MNFNSARISARTSLSEQQSRIVPHASDWLELAELGTEYDKSSVKRAVL